MFCFLRVNFRTAIADIGFSPIANQRMHMLIFCIKETVTVYTSLLNLGTGKIFLIYHHKNLFRFDFEGLRTFTIKVIQHKIATFWENEK